MDDFASGELMVDWGSSAESSCIVAAMDGNEEALSALWKSHRPWLAAILLTYKPREVDVEDLMQEVAVKFITKVHTLREAGAFRPWLRRIAVNTARESARSLKRNHESHNSVDTIETEHNRIPDNTSDSRDEAIALLQHAMTLPISFREPLLLRCVQGLSCKEIAEVMELPITTIETRVSRGRRMLREEWLKKTAPRLTQNTAITAQIIPDEIDSSQNTTITNVPATRQPR